jgi:hypothetical protein
MSALPPKADTTRRDLDVRFGSLADISLCPFDVRFTHEGGHEIVCLTTILFGSVVHDADLNANCSLPQQSQRIVAGLLSFLPTRALPFSKI